MQSITDECKEGQTRSTALLELTWEAALPQLSLKTHYLTRPANRFIIVPNKGQESVTLTGVLEDLDLGGVVEIRGLSCPKPEQLVIKNCHLSSQLYTQLLAQGVKDFSKAKLHVNLDFTFNKESIRTKFAKSKSLASRHLLDQCIFIDRYLHTCLERLIRPTPLHKDARYTLRDIVLIRLNHLIYKNEKGAYFQSVKKEYETAVGPFIQRAYDILNLKLEANHGVSNANLVEFQNKLEEILKAHQDEILLIFNNVVDNQQICFNRFQEFIAYDVGAPALWQDLSCFLRDFDRGGALSHMRWALTVQYPIFLEGLLAKTPGFSIRPFATITDAQVKLRSQLKRCNLLTKRAFDRESPLTKEEVIALLNEWNEYKNELYPSGSEFQWKSFLDYDRDKWLDFKTLLGIFDKTGYLEIDTYFPPQGPEGSASESVSPSAPKAPEDESLEPAEAEGTNAGLAAGAADLIGETPVDESHAADPPQPSAPIAPKDEPAFDAAEEAGYCPPPTADPETEPTQPTSNVAGDSTGLTVSPEDRIHQILNLLDSLSTADKISISEILKSQIALQASLSSNTAIRTTPIQTLTNVGSDSSEGATALERTASDTTPA